MAWERGKRKPEVLIGIPLREENISFEWAKAWKNLLVPTGSPILYPEVPAIDVARNMIVEEALRIGVKYIFFLDADVIPPPYAYIRLRSHRLPIVSGLYYTKVPRVKDEKGEVRPTPAMWRYNPKVKGLSPIIDWKPPKGLVEVDAVGMGCALIDTRVFKGIKPPWFEYRHNPLARTGLSEDLVFCEKAKKAGFPIYVDTAVECGHIMTARVVKLKDLGLGRIIPVR